MESERKQLPVWKWNGEAGVLEGISELNMPCQNYTKLSCHEMATCSGQVELSLRMRL